VKHGKRNARKNTLEEMLVVSVGRWGELLVEWLVEWLVRFGIVSGQDFKVGLKLYPAKDERGRVPAHVWNVPMILR
jgi:hypothetical protein